MEIFEDIKAVSFDFDGVMTLDSDAIHKKNAWGIALADYPGHEEHVRVGNTLYGNGKPGGRVEILRYVLEQHGVAADRIEKEVRNASAVFDEHVQTKILEDGLVPGAYEMLETLHARGIALYLNSGTATAPLRTSARNLGIDRFLKESLGSTKDPVGGGKVENLTYIAVSENLSPNNILMVGDGASDLRGAEQFGCPFLGVANRWNEWDKVEQLFPFVTDLREIPMLIA